MSLSKNQIIAVVAVVVIVVAAVAVAIGTTGGGSSDSDSGGSYEDGSVTIEVYTAADGFIEQTFDSIPERIVVGNMTVLETLLYFGLGDRIVAVYYLEDELWDNEYVQSEYQRLEARLGSEYITDGTFDQAFLVDLEPDLIMGYSSSFQESTFGTPSFWNSIGCNVWSTYCLNSSSSRSHNSSWDQMDLMRMDNENIGKVFDIESQTSEYMNQFESLVTNIRDNQVSGDVTVLIAEYHSSNNEHFSQTYGDNSFSGWLLSLTGATNYDPEAGGIDLAQVVDATELDGFVLITYGSSSTTSSFESEVIGNSLYSGVKPFAENNYISWGLNGNYGGVSALEILQSLYDYVRSL